MFTDTTGTCLRASEVADAASSCYTDGRRPTACGARSTMWSKRPTAARQYWTQASTPSRTHSAAARLSSSSTRRTQTPICFRLVTKSIVQYGLKHKRSVSTSGPVLRSSVNNPSFPSMRILHSKVT